jgi:hypothetical protein
MSPLFAALIEKPAAEVEDADFLGGGKGGSRQYESEEGMGQCA